MTDIFDTGDVTLLLRKLTLQVEKKQMKDCDYSNLHTCELS